ncbi:hypothetical protein ALI144C_01895 [Actinosynnema sp. ALI-1.44]|uniref:hypothetical protein n=1 Tax=Actinosynnema sp. ALI-1.44 TaxID=1933779 RepID=UPI00097C79CA|nr:hypothetical protein [Actinosynnema sp. ALI-1.44]ONI91000.1 hypothetical protein ALI144C_01895 [Actinosynnema sp. ALI-1.44]
MIRIGIILGSRFWQPIRLLLDLADHFGHTRHERRAVDGPTDRLALEVGDAGAEEIADRVEFRFQLRQW